MIAIAKTSVIKFHGINKILQPIIDDIKKLEDGIAQQDSSKVFGTVIAVTGDNLGVHEICGFKEDFTAHNCYRFCMASLNEVRTLTSENKVLMRSPLLYEEQIKELNADDGQQKANLSKLFGVNRLNFKQFKRIFID